MTENTPSATLADALQRYPLEVSAEQWDRLDHYCRLLWSWNEKLNLTRHTDYDKFVSRDLLDAVQLSRLLEAGEEVLDVGSGGGVPGVLLAILRPDLHIALSESITKKANVLKQIIASCGLSTPVHNARAEELLQDLRFDVLVARAVGPLWKMCKWFAPHWRAFRRLLVVKGPNWVEERGEARHRGLMHNVDLRKVASYPMPGTPSESVILQLSAKASPNAEG